MRVPLSRPGERAGDDRPDSDRGSRPPSSDSGLAVRLAEGARAGFVGTLAMTAYRLPISRSLPPTAEFWTEFVAGGEPDDHPVPAAALHLLYGTVGGVAFGLLAPIHTSDASDEELRSRTPGGDARTTAPAAAPTRDARADAGTDDARETARLEAAGLLAGVAYALALSVFGERVMLERLLDVDLEADESLVFHAGHVVYGLGLGTWFGSRTGDRR